MILAVQSGFDDGRKKAWLGSVSPQENDITKTNVPQTRMRFRLRLHAEELRLVREGPERWGEATTELAQYNERMLLSPSRAPRRQ